MGFPLTHASVVLRMSGEKVFKKNFARQKNFARCARDTESGSASAAARREVACIHVCKRAAKHFARVGTGLPIRLPVFLHRILPGRASPLGVTMRARTASACRPTEQTVGALS